MESATDQGPTAGPVNLLRLDRAVAELETAAAQFADRAAAASHSEAELERLRSLHETVSKRLDGLIQRLRELLRE